MPSLWKKQKGSKISRLVVDLQTTSPKRREALIVENGVPTSMVDFFGKNNDKLHKSSKKKQRSKKHNTTLTMEEYNYPFPRLPTLASKFISQSNLEEPASPIVEKNQEDIIDEHKTCDSELNGGSNTINTSDNEYSNCEKKGLFNAMHVFLLCILVSILGVGITLYYKVFKVGITLGTLFLVLLKLKLKLKYVGCSSFPLIKNYNGVIFLSILKGAFVVVVSLYTKRTIFGVSIGAFVLFLLEIVKKVIFPKRGQDVTNVEQIEIQNEESGKENVDVILNNVVDTCLEKDVCENGVSTNGTEIEVGGNEPKVKDGNTRCLKVKIMQGSNDSATCSEDEKIWNEIVNEIESLDKSYSIWPRQNQQLASIPTEFGEQLGKHETKGLIENNDECSNMTDQIDKMKKRRKFWKKLVPKHIRKNKKNKYGKEALESSVHCPDESATEVEEIEIEDKEETSSISSNDDNKDEEDEYVNVVNNSYVETLQVKDIDDANNNFGVKIKKNEIMKGVIVLVIPLVGLIGGRILAFVLTIVGCAMFSMLKG